MRPITLLVSALLCASAYGVEPRAAVPVFVEPTKGDDGQFSDILKVELMKRKGLIKAKVDIVRKPEDARYVLEVSITYQRDRKKSIWQSGERASAIASAMAYDACGKLVWSKVKGDRDIFGDAHGAIETAQKMAASFKEALAKKDSRLNRALPCLVPDGEWKTPGS